ncbi:MAG: hypothetical protein OEV78_11325, partial [Spirochaetia bacterium]|nr:hypothetical protein [Spirochaetia bacterium]
KKPPKISAQAGFHENKLGVMFSESDLIRNGEGENARSTIFKENPCFQPVYCGFLPMKYRCRLRLGIAKSKAGSCGNQSTA